MSGLSTLSFQGRGYGAIAQLGERLHGMQEVSGSIPLSSTKFFKSQSHRLKRDAMFECVCAPPVFK
jgi:hypothetical protein